MEQVSKGNEGRAGEVAGVVAGLKLNVEERGVRERSGVENWEIEVEEGETSA